VPGQGSRGLFREQRPGPRRGPQRLCAWHPHPAGPEGRAVIEVPYAKDMLDKVEFDTIYHEHLCYYSLTALHLLFRQHALRIEDVKRLSIHGGTLRLFVGHEAATRQGQAVSDLLQEEAAWGVDRPQYYLDFAERVKALKASLRDLIASLKRNGKRVAAYGAAAKAVRS